LEVLSDYFQDHFAQRMCLREVRHDDVCRPSIVPIAEGAYFQDHACGKLLGATFASSMLVLQKAAHHEV
jgi:hypothetical protein